MASNIDLQFNFDMSSPVRETKSSKLMTRTPTFNLASRSSIEVSTSPVHVFRSPYSLWFVLYASMRRILCARTWSPPNSNLKMIVISFIFAAILILEQTSWHSPQFLAWITLIMYTTRPRSGSDVICCACFWSTFIRRSHYQMYKYSTKTQYWSITLLLHSVRFSGMQKCVSLLYKVAAFRCNRQVVRCLCFIAGSRVAIEYRRLPVTWWMVSCHHCHCRFDINVTFWKSCWVCVQT